MRRTHRRKVVTERAEDKAEARGGKRSPKAAKTKKGNKQNSENESQQ